MSKKTTAPQKTDAELNMEEHAEVVANLQGARNIATKLFGNDATAETVLETYDILMSGVDDEDGEESFNQIVSDLETSKEMAKEAGIGDSPTAVFGIYERVFLDLDDDDEEDYE